MEALCGFIRINVSAASYLADFGTSVLTLVEYYTYKQGLLRQSFYFLVIMMSIGHIVAAVAFKMTLPNKHKPLQSAYFLPLMLLWRMVKASRASWKKSLLELKLMDEATALFGMVALSLDTAPSIFIQFSAIYRRRIHDSQFRVSLLLKLSIAAALISAAFNGGIGVVSKAKNVKSKRSRAVFGILAGIHVSSAMFLRCMSCAVLLLDGVPWIPLWLAYLILLWVLHWLIISSGSFLSKLTLRSAGFAFVMAYMGCSISPLYTVASEAEQTGKLGTPLYELRLAFMTLFVQSIPVALSSLLLLKHRDHAPDVMDGSFFVLMGMLQACAVVSVLGVIAMDYCSGSPDSIADAAIETQSTAAEP